MSLQVGERVGFAVGAREGEVRGLVTDFELDGLSRILRKRHGSSEACKGSGGDHDQRSGHAGSSHEGIRYHMPSRRLLATAALTLLLPAATSWRCGDANVSAHSRTALQTLHTLFPQTEWARKTKYWY
jgi:hypothetical protein